MPSSIGTSNKNVKMYLNVKILFYVILCRSERHLAKRHRHEYWSLIKAETFGLSNYELLKEEPLFASYLFTSLLFALT